MTNFKKIESVITANGWVLVREIGSHRQYKHPTISNSIIISYSQEKEMTTDIIRNLELRTGLSLQR